MYRISSFETVVLYTDVVDSIELHLTGRHDGWIWTVKAATVMMRQVMTQEVHLSNVFKQSCKKARACCCFAFRPFVVFWGLSQYKDVILPV